LRWSKKKKRKKARKASQFASPPSPDAKLPPALYECKWTDEQRSFFIALLASHGRNWPVIADALAVPEEEVNSYYNLFREELALDEFLPEGVRRTRMRPAGLGSSGGGVASPSASSSTPQQSRPRSRLPRLHPLLGDFLSFADSPADELLDQGVVAELSSSLKRDRDPIDVGLEGEPAAKRPKHDLDDAQTDLPPGTGIMSPSGTI